MWVPLLMESCSRSGTYATVSAQAVQQLCAFKSLACSQLFPFRICSAQTLMCSMAVSLCIAPRSLLEYSSRQLVADCGHVQHCTFHDSGITSHNVCMWQTSCIMSYHIIEPLHKHVHASAYAQSHHTIELCLRPSKCQQQIQYPASPLPC